MTVQKEPRSGPDPRTTAFNLDSLVERLRAADAPYLEFLALPALRCGLYLLPVGGVDRQNPHTEVEIYFVIRGSASALLDGAQSGQFKPATRFTWRLAWPTTFIRLWKTCSYWLCLPLAGHELLDCPPQLEPV